MTDDVKKEKKKANRSSGYPVFSLEDCVEAIKLVKQNLGGEFSSRDLVAKAMGYSGVTGASGTKISACVHFGLLDRSGNTYALSNLSEKILTPVSESEKAEALIDAVKSPNLYNKLITAYSGKALPMMLENILCRDYKIIDNSAKRAVEVFKKSLDYSGILHNGVIQQISHTNEETDNNKESANESVYMAPTTNTPNGQKLFTNNLLFTINLSNTGAKLLIPNDFSYDVSIGALAEEIRALSNKLREINKNAKENKNEPEAKM